MLTQEKPPAEMATDSPHWIGVHVLSQFVFCPRAGINAHEQPDNFEPEVSEARLDVMPNFDLAILHERLRRAFCRAVVLLLAAGILFYLGTVLGRHLDPCWILVGTGISVIALFAASFFAVQTTELFLQFRELKNAQPREPDPHSEHLGSIHWGEMLNAGFEPWRPNESMVHEAWKLKGKPLLILRRHGLRIPVIIMPEDSAKVHDKYVVRIAAYCHLLERSENATSPYGIVLKAKSYQGITVPNCSWTRQLFHRELQKARRHLNGWKSSKTPPVPPPEEFCKGCAFGEPKPLECGVPQSPVGSLSLPVVPITDGGPVQHSDCGDRFNWVAPHETTMKKALKRTT